MLNNENIFIEYLNKKINELNKKIKEIEKNDSGDNYKEGNLKQFLIFLKSLITLKGGISNILMNYKDSIELTDFSSNDREKHILGLVDINELKKRDYKRYILGTVPFANYVFTTILNSGKNNLTLKLDYLDELNPFKQKYNNIKINNLETKFECLRDYINENSFALDAAAIGGMAGATDFLQLYKFVMDEDIIESENRTEIIKKLFIVLQSDSVEKFITNYTDFINILKKHNNSTKKTPDGKDKKLLLVRLYNRLYFIFSFILNNLKPEIFPIYFSATRNTLRTFGIEGYENVAKIYNDFINEFNTKENESIINEYLKRVGIDESNYCPELEKEFPYDKKIIFGNYKTKRNELFTNHAKYRFFQDLCWVINRNILDGQDYVNNLGKSKTFKFEELKNKIYPFEKDQDGKLIENLDNKEDKKITFGEIINIDYLISEGYITKISPGEYQVIKTDPYFIRDKK